MTRTLQTTPRADIRAGSGVNTQFAVDPSVYTVDGEPNPTTLGTLRDVKIGYVRERWFPNSPAQNAAFDLLTAAGVGLFLYIGKVDTYTPDRAAADVASLAESSYADSVVAVCGPNEANAPQNKKWPHWAVALQKAIYTTVHSYPDFAKHVAITSCALMHNNVKDLDHDYRALKRAGIQRWCDYGDFHFYPGNAGPILNAAEAKRAREAFGKLPLWQSETGWTGTDTDPDTAGRFTVEALLRNYLTGIVGTLIYEFADMYQYVPGREGYFGTRTPFGPKPAYKRLRQLLATRDGNEPFDGYLDDYSQGVESDVGAIVTSEGGGNWTVYLMKQKQDHVTVVVKGPFGDRSYKVAMDESMVVLYVSLETGGNVHFGIASDR